ncbi:hypothetical protein NKJ40_15095 [Mesorhizobium sp. M0119]
MDAKATDQMLQGKSQMIVKTSRRKLPPTLLLVLPAVRRIVGWFCEPVAR